MKYFIIHGDHDYDFELEIEEYETKQEAVNRVAFLKENNYSDYRVNVIKGERMGIISSWDIEEKAC